MSGPKISPHEGKDAQPKSAERKARSAAALRENLKRRKQQARLQSDAASEPPQPQDGADKQTQ